MIKLVIHDNSIVIYKYRDSLRDIIKEYCVTNDLYFTVSDRAHIIDIRGTDEQLYNILVHISAYTDMIIE